MNRAKQIEEMASIIYAGKSINISCVDVAEALYNSGYRKVSDVAEDIIRMLRAAGINEWRYPIVADIKKKYTEG